MEIIINRASVCMGDDIDNHAKKIVLSDNATYDDLLNIIIAEKYLPGVSGNNVVWVLSSEKYPYILSYFTRTKIRFGVPSQKRLSALCENSNELMFHYFSSPMRWKTSILNWYGKEITCGKQHDDWQKECEYCDYVMSLGYE